MSASSGHGRYQSMVQPLTRPAGVGAREEEGGTWLSCLQAGLPNAPALAALAAHPGTAASSAQTWGPRARSRAPGAGGRGRGTGRRRTGCPTCRARLRGREWARRVVYGEAERRRWARHRWVGGGTGCAPGPQLAPAATEPPAPGHSARMTGRTSLSSASSSSRGNRPVTSPVISRLLMTCGGTARPRQGGAGSAEHRRQQRQGQQVAAAHGGNMWQLHITGPCPPPPHLKERLVLDVGIGEHPGHGLAFEPHDAVQALRRVEGGWQEWRA